MASRREAVLAIILLSSAPLAGGQKSSKPARVGILAFGTPEGPAAFLIDAFKQGLRELGYTERKDLIYEVRWALGKTERLPELASELIRLKPDVIWVTSDQSIAALRRESTSIPIVSPVLGDVVRQGFADSLARPARNVTGFSNLAVDLAPKLLELLLTIVPKASRVGFLWNPSNTNTTARENAESAAAKVGVKLMTFAAQNPAETEDALARMKRENVDGAIIAADVVFVVQRRRIAELTTSNAVPTVFPFRGYVEADGLLSYGANDADIFKRSATYVDKILKGANPGDLPIEQSMKFELVINLKTAKALGLTIPQSLLLRADEVIQ